MSGAGATASAGGVGLATQPNRTAALLGGDEEYDTYTRIAYRALVDAVLPETPELEDELGPEYVPGGLSIGLAEFMIEYVDSLFALDLPLLSDDQGNLYLSKSFAKILDKAALKLILIGENESSVRLSHAEALTEDLDLSWWTLLLTAGTFSKLDRMDRLRAIALIDEFDIELSYGDFLFEFDAGMVGQLVVGFTEAVYYGDWQGYDDFWQPPSEREHSNDPGDIQGWQQSGFPGVAPGNGALRGYLGAPDSPLGEGETWKTFGDVEITLESGSFPENDYDTSDFEEVYPDESDRPFLDGDDGKTDNGETDNGETDDGETDDGETDDGDEVDDEDDGGGWWGGGDDDGDDVENGDDDELSDDGSWWSLGNTGGGR